MSAGLMILMCLLATATVQIGKYDFLKTNSHFKSIALSVKGGKQENFVICHTDSQM
jgi:hypothetical protein